MGRMRLCLMWRKEVLLIRSLNTFNNMMSLIQFLG